MKSYVLFAVLTAVLTSPVQAFSLVKTYCPKNDVKLIACAEGVCTMKDPMGNEWVLDGVTDPMDIRNLTYDNVDVAKADGNPLNACRYKYIDKTGKAVHFSAKPKALRGCFMPCVGFENYQILCPAESQGVSGETKDFVDKVL